MKTSNHLLISFVSVTLSFILLSCEQSAPVTPTTPASPTTPVDNEVTVTVDFEYGTDGPSSAKNIYVVWIEDMNGAVLKNLAVCQRLLNGTLTGIALPFWKMNRYDEDEVDAVTGATLAKQDFSVSGTLPAGHTGKFKVCFETDRSFDANDFFEDQPALLYSVEIDPDSNTSEYTLTLEAWTPNKDANAGIRQPELRYITHMKDETGPNAPFGDEDPEHSATCFVEKIGVTITK